MHPRHLLVPLATATLALVGVGQTAAGAPLARQDFTLTSDINDDGGGTVVASGVINASGQDVVISDTQDQFVFPAGSLTVIHAALRDHEHLNDKTCDGMVRETGTYVISAGTGSYTGVTGSGSYRVVARFQGDCQGPPVGTVNITARGSLNLPSS
jgi:hypothetical protein